MAKIANRVKKLKVGKSFTVGTERDRKDALAAAQVIGKRIVTRARPDGGFTVTCLPK